MSQHPHHGSTHPQVKMVPVKSTNISDIGYHPESHTLWVNFTNGTRYIYNGVTPKTHADFMASQSKGKFFHSQIRGKYQHNKLP